MAELTIDAACRLAERLLSATYQTSLQIEVEQQFESAHIVLRCVLHPGDRARALPATVIIKQRTDQVARSQDFDQAQLFANEWASLAFLAGSAAEVALGPRLYASDQQHGLVILEDLGVAPTVQEVLYHTERAPAAAALVELGACLGRIQAATHGREQGFRAQQQQLGTTTPLSDANLDCRTRLSDLEACMRALDIAIPADFATALDRLEGAIHGPGPFRSFAHNDAGPHNAQLTAAGVRLLDFEFAGYGHGLLDVVCARLAFPPAFRGRRSPPELVAQLEAAYRTHMARQIVELSDDLYFAQAVAQASAHWAFSKLLGFWRYLRERLSNGEAYDSRAGRAPERSAFFRQQVFSYLRLALATLEQYNQLPELRDVLARLVERLLALWPNTPMLDHFPAFGGKPWSYP